MLRQGADTQHEWDALKTNPVKVMTLYQHGEVDWLTLKTFPRDACCLSCDLFFSLSVSCCSSCSSSFYLFRFLSISSSSFILAPHTAVMTPRWWKNIRKRTSSARPFFSVYIISFTSVLTNRHHYYYNHHSICFIFIPYFLTPIVVAQMVIVAKITYLFMFNLNCVRTYILF